MTRDHAPDAAPGGDIFYPSAIPFLLVHLGCLAAIWTGITWAAVGLCVSLYWLRMFAVTAGYHRYFSHRAFATGRVFQFLLAFLAQSTAQKSVVGGQASPPPSLFRHRVRCPFAAPCRLFLQPRRMAVRASARRDRSRSGSRPGALSRASLAPQVRDRAHPHFVFYNFTRIHKTLRMSPAMAAWITDRLWTLEDIVAKIDAMAPQPKARGPYKKRS